MHPILFEIPLPAFAEPYLGGTLPIFSYGVMLGTSFILAWYIVMELGERDGIHRDVLANAFIVAALSAIVGSRVLYIATNPDEFDTVVSWFALRRGGLVAYGGFLGGFVGSLIYLRRAKVPLLRFADVTAPTLALGLAFTRIGCYLYGCDFGAPLSDDAPDWLQGWGTFPHWDNDEGSPAWSHHVMEYGLEPEAGYSLPVHPTQLYESAAGFTLVAITFFVWTRRQFHGQVLFVLTMSYGIWRFLIEYVRDDPERGEAFGFSTSQLISLALVPIAGFFYWQRWTEHKKKPVPVYHLGGTPHPVPQLALAGAAAGGRKSSSASAADDEEDERPAGTSSTKKPTRQGGKPGKKKRR